MFRDDVQVQLERQVKIDCLPGDHKSQNIQGDLVKIIRELQKAEVFKHQPGRSHPSFQEEPADIFSPVDQELFRNGFKKIKKSMSITSWNFRFPKLMKVSYHHWLGITLHKYNCF